MHGVAWVRGALGFEDGEDALVPGGHLRVRRVPGDESWSWTWVVTFRGRTEAGHGEPTAELAKAAAEAALRRLRDEGGVGA